MFKEILHFNDRDWIVRLTRKAMIEIEDMQKRKQRELINKEDNIEVLSKIGEVYKIQEEIDKANKMKDEKARDKKIAGYMQEYLPLAMKLEASDIMEVQISAYELVYILIRNYPNNGELNKEEYEKGLFELEENLGLLELEKKFKEMSNKVFQEIESIKVALNQPVDMTQKAS